MPVTITVLLLMSLAVAARVFADAADLGDLKEQYQTLGSQRDSLKIQRQLVSTEAETLSTRVDSLKLNEENAEELQESLRSSLGLIRRMAEIDRWLVALDVRQDSIEQRLRLVYDWEIGVLIQKLSTQTDRGLLTQLMVYQDAREQLGAKINRSALSYGEQMLIGVDDGPDEIHQKLALMEDLAYRLRAEMAASAELLQWLEEELRLRIRMGRNNGKGQAANRLLFAHGDQSTGQVRYRVGASTDDESELVATTVEKTVLEIRKLKARRQEVYQLQAVVEDRAKAFRLYLRDMLEGEE